MVTGRPGLKYRIIREHPVPQQGGVRGDHWIELESARYPKYRQVLRVVTIRDEEQQRELVPDQSPGMGRDNRGPDLQRTLAD